MKGRDFKFEDDDRRGGKGWIAGLLLAGVAVGAPVIASAVIRKRAEPPQAPRWGRGRRYAGSSGEIVFQELGHRRGDGPPLVLLHAFGPGYDSQQWRPAAELLAGRHAVYVPDLPGWGRSAAPRQYSPRVYASAIEDFLTEVVREPAVVVAAGLSAAYALRVAVENPRSVRGLALVCPLGLAEADARPANPFLSQLLGLPVVKDTVLDLLTSRASLEHHLRREVYAAPERVDAALLDHHYRASHLARARATYAAYLRGELWQPVDGELSQVGVPVWLAWGRAAAEPPVERADLWLKRLPAVGTAEVDVLEGSGSLPHAETPAAFCNALERFISGIA